MDTKERIERIINKTLLTGFSLLKIPKGLFAKKFPDNLTKERSSPLLIAGNGPSFNRMFSEKRDILESSDLMVVNFFNESGKMEELKPKYWVILDPIIFAEPDEKGYASEQGKETVHFRNKQWSQALRSTQLNINLFYPSQALRKKNFPEVLSQFPDNIHLVPFNYTAGGGFNQLFYFFWNRNILAPYSQNVIIISIYLGILLGYKKIYLTGVDHNLLHMLKIDKENKMYRDSTEYFWGYFDKTIQYRTPYTESVRRMYIILMQYYEIKKYALSHNVELINLSPNSYIEALPKE